jgi:hypothetical protein
MTSDRVPELLPVLSRGKHRSPRKGACFMEMASVLGGERWSDHPSCTHPLLAQTARMVNDATTDGERNRLALLIPDVVGVTGGGLRWAVGFTSAVAIHALPDAPEPTQRALAAGLIRAGQLADTLGPQPVPGTEGIPAALATIPWAVTWAQRFGSDRPIRPKVFLTRSAPAIVTSAVKGTADAAAPDPDGRLRALLEFAIATATRLQALAVTPAPAPRAATTEPA